jgi:hypothetical protein
MNIAGSLTSSGKPWSFCIYNGVIDYRDFSTSYNGRMLASGIDFMNYVFPIKGCLEFEAD